MIPTFRKFLGSVLISVLITPLCLSPLAHSEDEYTREKVCARLNHTDDLDRPTSYMAAAGIGALFAAVPDLMKEYKAWKKISADNITYKATESELAKFLYEREMLITKKFLAQKGIENLVVEVELGETPTQAFVREFSKFEDRELGSRSINNLIKKYAKSNVNLDKTRNVLLTIFDSNKFLVEGTLDKIEDKRYDNNQAKTKLQESKDLRAKAPRDGLSDITVTSLGENKGQQKFSMKDALILEQKRLKEMSIHDPFVITSSGNATRSTAGPVGDVTPPKIKNKAVSNESIDPKTSFNFSENAEGNHEEAVIFKDKAYSNPETSRTGNKLGVKACAVGGLTGLVAVGIVGSLSHYCDNEISKEFEMKLPKANRDQFAKMRSGYEACLQAVIDDPILFMAVKTAFQTKDQDTRSPAQVKPGK